MKVKFFTENGKIKFTIPENPQLEADVRASIKKQAAPIKNALFFKRGIYDAIKSVQNGEPRKLGTPIVVLEDPFSGKKMQMTCQEAKSFMQDIGGNYHIYQISGHPLPEGYFSEFTAPAP